MVAKYGKIAHTLRFRAYERQWGGRGCSFKTYGEEHDVLFGITARQFERIRGGVNDPNVRATRFVLERTSMSSRDTHHVAEGCKNKIRLSSQRQAIVDASHRKHTNRAAWAVNQFHVCWE